MKLEVTRYKFVTKVHFLSGEAPKPKTVGM